MKRNNSTKEPAALTSETQANQASVFEKTISIDLYIKPSRDGSDLFWAIYNHPRTGESLTLWGDMGTGAIRKSSEPLKDRTEGGADRAKKSIQTFGFRPAKDHYLLDVHKGVVKFSNPAETENA